MAQDNNGDYEVVATKVSKYVRRRMKQLLKQKGLTEYVMLQMVYETIVRYMDDRHNLTPEMERAMFIFEHLRGWANAFNLDDPTVVPEIIEATYYIGDPTKIGVRAVHVERPMLKELSEQWIQTINVQEILEQTICLLMPERYKRLRMLAVDNNCNSILQLIDMLIDEHSKDIDVAEVRRGFEDANRSDYGRTPADAPYKRKHYKTVNDNRLTDPAQGSLFVEDDIDGDELLNGI